MPPKFKFTKEEIINAALNVARDSGIEEVTAKAVAEKLGVSTQPVFTCFSNMTEAKNEVRKAAEKVYDCYAEQGLKENIPFLGVGKAYIRFAVNEPNLYKLLFLTEPDECISGAIAEMKRLQGKVRPYLMDIYNLTTSDADEYFRDLWLVVHSIATLKVTKCCDYSEKEIEKILTAFSVSICKAIKEIPDFTTGNFDRDAVFYELIKK